MESYPGRETKGLPWGPFVASWVLVVDHTLTPSVVGGSASLWTSSVTVQHWAHCRSDTFRPSGEECRPCE